MQAALKMRMSGAAKNQILNSFRHIKRVSPMLRDQRLLAKNSLTGKVKEGK
jgi:hypothetical protein